MQERAVYRNLQKHLNRQSVGYPATLTGADRRLLRHFFTPQEARVALGLTYRPRSAGEIYTALGKPSLPLHVVEHHLSSMTKRGSVGYKTVNDQECYFILPLVVGMYETHLNVLSDSFLKDFKAYTSSPSFGLAFIGTELPQMRTIPVEESVNPELSVASYDHIRSIIEASEGPIVVNECICRKKAAIQGEPCRRTSRTETCLALGDSAGLCQKMEIGRTISKNEALEIIRCNEADGLVLQPSNTQKVEYICACCGCCCGLLRIQQELAHPLAFWAANYFATVDPRICTGCGVCTDICQVGAAVLHTGDEAAVINPLRCIGCGNCVPRCPSQAIVLNKKETTATPPHTLEDLYDDIMRHKKGFWKKFVLGLKIILKINPK